MSGQIAGTSIVSLELVATIVVVSMLVGVVDAARQPGWAWKRAEESKAAWMVLVGLVPLVGLGMYLSNARPKVSAIATSGRAASLPFEQFGNDITPRRDETWPIGAVAPPQRFVKVGANEATDGEIRLVEAIATSLGSSGPGRQALGGGGTALRSAATPVGLTRAYRPKQRASLPLPDAAEGLPTTTVPAGWKADPTGRHQFRYWSGAGWTDNVADNGEQSRDVATS
jgi:hypothetical protein